MRTRIFLTALMAVLVLILLMDDYPAFAQGIPDVYVDTGYTGSEAGTARQPYNTLVEGIAFARAQPGGAWLYVKQPDGTWKREIYVAPVVSGASGGEGGPVAVVTDTAQSPQVTEAPTSSLDTETPTSPQVTQTPTSSPDTETPTSPQVTQTPVSPSLTETPLANAVVYGLVAILAVGLVLAVYSYQRRFRRP